LKAGLNREKNGGLSERRQKILKMFRSRDLGVTVEQGWGEGRFTSVGHNLIQKDRIEEKTRQILKGCDQGEVINRPVYLKNAWFLSRISREFEVIGHRRWKKNQGEGKRAGGVANS